MDYEKFEKWFRSIMARFDKLERVLEYIMKMRGSPDSDKLLDNQDLCTMFGVTKRTLARYRQKKLVRYYMIGRRVFYKASEIEEFLKKKGKS